MIWESALGARSSGRADRLRPGLRRLEGAAVGRVCAAREREIVWQAEVELIRGRVGEKVRGVRVAWRGARADTELAA